MILKKIGFRQARRRPRPDESLPDKWQAGVCQPDMHSGGDGGKQYTAPH